MNKRIVGIALFLALWIGAFVFLLTEDLATVSRNEVGIVPKLGLINFHEKRTVLRAPITDFPPTTVPTEVVDKEYPGMSNADVALSTKSSLAQCLEVATTKESEMLKEGRGEIPSAREWIYNTLTCFEKAKNLNDKDELEQLVDTAPNFVAKTRQLFDQTKKTNDFSNMEYQLYILKKFSNILELKTGRSALPSDWENWVKDAVKMRHTVTMKRVEEKVAKKRFIEAWNELGSLEDHQRDLAEYLEGIILPSNTEVEEGILTARKALVEDVLLERGEEGRHFLVRGENAKALLELGRMREVMTTIHESPSSEFTLLYEGVMGRTADELVALYNAASSSENQSVVLNEMYFTLLRAQGRELVMSDPRVEEIIASTHAKDIENILKNDVSSFEEKRNQTATTCELARGYGITHLHSACSN